MTLAYALHVAEKEVGQAKNRVATLIAVLHNTPWWRLIQSFKASYALEMAKRDMEHKQAVCEKLRFEIIKGARR